jgi:SulP family sulfate permease
MARRAKEVRPDQPGWAIFLPKLVTCLKEGYGAGDLRRDTLAGLSVAIVALPLAMALAIASGTTPDRGLVTAVVAGFMISAFGGSRFQIGGPTGAFVVVVYSVIERHGLDGLILATAMAGILLTIFALARLGTVIKFIPYPVVTGFTAGIALIIFSSQISELFGLGLSDVPGDFLAKWEAYAGAAANWQPAAVAVSGATLAAILLVRRYRPQWPSFLIAVALGTAITLGFDLPVETIGSRFGELPRMLPAPAVPEVTLARLVDLFPDALTIAFLAGIESLLSAVIADGLTGGRHRSNGELLGQGLANLTSAAFGGLPATGAIARTVTNIKSGGRTPVAGILHAVFLLVFMLLLAEVLVYVPLASLAAVLVIVAWNMSEIEHFARLLRAPRGDALVLLVTFGLTVLADLTLAIQVGIVLAALLFMRRMSEVTEVEVGQEIMQRDVADAPGHPELPRHIQEELPAGVEVFQINGPFFFGVATRLQHVLDSLRKPPKVFIVRMRQVPMVDASGAHALGEFIDRCRKHGTEVLLTAVQPQPRRALLRMGFARRRMVPNIDAALARAKDILAEGERGDVRRGTGSSRPALAAHRHRKAPGPQE